MSEEQVVAAPYRSRGRRGITGAVLLIGFGSAFLLSNLGLLEVNWWGMLRYWPVFLILIGIDMILGRTLLGSLIAVAIALAAVVGVIYLAGLQDSPAFLGGETITRQVSEELGSADTLMVEMRLGAISADIDAVDDDRYAVQGEYTTIEDLALEITYRDSRDGHLVLQQNDRIQTFPTTDFIGDLDIGLNDSVPLSLIIDAGVGSLDVDLTGFELTSLTINGGVGDIAVVLPSEGHYTAVIEAGVGSITVVSPESLEARVEFDGGLANLDMPSNYEKLADGVWETAGYNAADDVLIQVGAGVGNVRFEN